MNNSDRAYKKMLEDKIKKTQAEIRELESKNKGIRLINDYTTEKIARKEIEISKLREELENYTERVELGAVGATFVETFDEIVDIHDERRQEIQNKLEELRDLKAKLTTARARRKIERKIEKQQAILKRLQKSDNRISGIQRAFMYPKYHKEMRKNTLISKQEAKLSVAQAKIKDTEALQEMLDPNNSFIDGIKDIIYEIKKSKYQKKMERAAEILNEMQKCESPIQMMGAVPVVISKRLKDKFAGKLKQDQMMQGIKINNQTNNVALATAK